MPNSTRIDLNRLEIFKTVVSAGSFSKAAAQLKQPKSRVSRNISALEHELGVSLIYRTTRQFKLTDAGHALYNKISPLLTDIKSSIEMVSQSSDEVEGPIKLTVPEDIGTELMGSITSKFLQNYPKIKLNIISSNDYLDIVSDSIDVAIRIGQIRDSSMIQKHIGIIQMGFFASPDYIRNQNITGNINTFEKLDHLCFKPNNSKMYSLKLNKGKVSKTFKINPKFISNNFFILRSMAIQNMGIAQIPVFLGKKSVQEGKLIPIFTEWSHDPVPIRILIPQQKETPLRIKKLMEFLAQNIAAHL